MTVPLSTMSRHHTGPGRARPVLLARVRTGSPADTGRAGPRRLRVKRTEAGGEEEAGGDRAVTRFRGQCDSDGPTGPRRSAEIRVSQSVRVNKSPARVAGAVCGQRRSVGGVCGC